MLERIEGATSNMGTVNFDFVEPASLEQACRCLAESKGALALAGGTDLLRDIRNETKRPRLLVSLARIPELCGIEETRAGDLIIGPLTTMVELASDERVQGVAPALAEAAARMGSPQVRNRATVGGNICNARPCADTVPPLIVHGAVLVLRSGNGSREVPAAEFISGPGQTVRSPDEILASIRLPAPPEAPAVSGSAYETVTNRKAVEITITSATARVTLSGPSGTITASAICLGSVGPTPLLGPSGEAALVGRQPTDAVLNAAAAAVVADSRPIDDFRGSAEYRRHLVQVLTRRALVRAVQRALGGAR